MKWCRNIREFLMWLMSWAGDTTFSLNWNCSKCESHLIIPFTDLNSRQREILESFRQKGFTDGSAEWIRRTYSGINDRGRKMLVTVETRIISLLRNSVVQVPQFGGFFGMGMMPTMTAQQRVERFWDSHYEMVLITPEERYQEGYAEFERINNSIRILPAMGQIRSEILAVVNNSLNQMAVDNMNSMNRRSQIIADTNAYTSNIQHQMISDNAASHNRVANLQSEAIRGVNTYYTNDNRVIVEIER